MRIGKIIKEIRKRIDKYFLVAVGPKRCKYISELRYWKRKAQAGPLANTGYVLYYTTVFGIDLSFYGDKKILDIGCSPRGSLEWAEMASERVGLDPLVGSYKKLGIERHKMTYVEAFSEKIPYPNGYFDVVSSVNSLDHLDDLDKSIAEIIRVTAPGGDFLLLVEVNHPPTRCEPITFSWEITEKFLGELELLEEKHYEIVPPGYMLTSIKEGGSYNHSDPTERTGILAARFRKICR